MEKRESQQQFEAGLPGWDTSYLLNCLDTPEVNELAKEAIRAELRRRGVVLEGDEPPSRKRRAFTQVKLWAPTVLILSFIAFSVYLNTDVADFGGARSDFRYMADHDVARSLARARGEPEPTLDRYVVDLRLFDQPSVSQEELNDSVQAVLWVLEHRRQQRDRWQKRNMHVRIAFYEHGFPVMLDVPDDALAAFGEYCNCIMVDMHRMRKWRPEELSMRQWLTLVMGHEGMHLWQHYNGDLRYAEHHTGHGADKVLGQLHPIEVEAESEGIAVTDAMQGTELHETLSDGRILTAPQNNPYRRATYVEHRLVKTEAKSSSRFLNRFLQMFE